MTKLDFYWKSNPEWYHMTEFCDFVVNDDAPEEAKKCYENYLRQLREKSKKGLL